MKKILVLFFVLFVISITYFFDLQNFLSLSFLKNQLSNLLQLYAQYPIIFISLFFIFYVVVTATFLPVALILTLAAGAFFGLIYGTIIVSFASSIGATIAFLLSRYVFRESVQKHYPDLMQTINSGIKKEGIFYLFSLRLIPVIPFFVINLLMGMTKISVWTFYWVSQLGMLIGTILYVNAGVQIAQIRSMDDILSTRVILALTALGIFPLIAKKTINLIRLNKIYAPYRSKKPKKFDYNIVVIGGGSAGLVTSYLAATVKSKVALIEKSKMGGDCLNTGCVPSKALIKCANVLHEAKKSEQFGVFQSNINFDFKKAKERIEKVKSLIAPRDAFDRYEKLGVEGIYDTAKITSPWTVQVGHRTLTTQNIVIAAGAHPIIPNISGIPNIKYYTSDNIWDMEEIPKKLLVLGGGPIGSELSQCFARLGSKVIMVEKSNRIMSVEDEDVSQAIMERFKKEGIEILTEHTAKEFKSNSNSNILICEHNGQNVEIGFDKVLIAVGRQPTTHGFGLEELKIDLRENGSIKVDDCLRTNYPNIYACGDITGPFQFTHMASYQAQICFANALFGKFKKTTVSYKSAAWCTFTHPEIASVGLNEQAAKAKSISYELTKYDIGRLDRAITDDEDMAFIKILTVPKKDKILGVTIVGAQASNMIAEFVSAIKNGVGLDDVLQTIHVYPSLASGNQDAAGEWKKKHTSKKLIHFLKKYFAWSRGC